jgi:polyisoprenoid-binding protein YceI
MTVRKLWSKTAIAVTAVLTVAAGPQPTTWNVDAAHTAVSFSVKHFFTPVKGQFEQFDVELKYDRQNPENSSVHVKIPVAGLSTGNPKRDNHLKSGDFFEADADPFITFVSETVKEVNDGELLVRGPLTIKGQTRTVELPVKVLGVMDVAPDMRDMLGGVGQIASFQTRLSLDRRDFGVGVGSWAATMVVGSAVDIEIAVEANR